MFRLVVSKCRTNDAFDQYVATFHTFLDTVQDNLWHALSDLRQRKNTVVKGGRARARNSTQTKAHKTQNKSPAKTSSKQNNDDYVNQLVEASKEGNEKRVKTLLKKHSYTKKIKTQALLNASENGHLGTVIELSTYGADLNANNGQPLLDAVERNSAGDVETLVEVGASLTNKSFKRALELGHSQVYIVLYMLKGFRRR